MITPFPFHLRDADEAAAASPYTFLIPSREERVAIAPGDLVKLGFEYEWQTEEYGGERMWVRVIGKTGLQFTGTLDNQPFEMGLQQGMLVSLASNTSSASYGWIRLCARCPKSTPSMGITVLRAPVSSMPGCRLRTFTGKSPIWQRKEMRFPTVAGASGGSKTMRVLGPTKAARWHIWHSARYSIVMTVSLACLINPLDRRSCATLRLAAMIPAIEPLRLDPSA